MTSYSNSIMVDKKSYFGKFPGLGKFKREEIDRFENKEYREKVLSEEN